MCFFQLSEIAQQARKLAEQQENRSMEVEGLSEKIANSSRQALIEAKEVIFGGKDSSSVRCHWSEPKMEVILMLGLWLVLELQGALEETLTVMIRASLSKDSVISLLMQHLYSDGEIMKELPVAYPNILLSKHLI